MPNITDIFKTSAALRDQLTEEQSKEIQAMYEDLAKKIAKQAKDPKYQLTQSGILQQQYLSELQKQIEAWSKELSNGLYTQVQSTMNLISDAVVQDNVEWLYSLGLGDKKGLSAAFSNVNQSVVNAIMTGSVYGNAGSWSLSKSIWGDNEKNLQKIYSLIAEGYAAQMPVGDIADMISQYVDPKRKLDWTGPNGKRIYGHKVDYNAQRLVRTLSQHTYQQSLVQCTQDNPFITGFVWIANGSRVCDLCKKRDGKFFKKDELPLDHPNGMCVMRPAVKKNMTQDLAGWVKGTNKNPEIDAFAKKLGYDPSSAGAGMTLGDIKKKFGDLAVGKKIGQFQSKLPKDVQDQLKKLKQDSGMSWDDFYTQNFDGAVSEKIKAAKKVVAPKVDDAVSTAADVKKALKEKQEKELKEKLEKVLKDALVPSKNTQKRLDDALSFTSRREADKYHRSFIDKLWDRLTDREKYSIWEYTHNSNPINKPLSGYANGSWNRSDFVGVGNARWDTEDMWRRVMTSEFTERFAKDASGHVSYERVIEDLTKAIQKSKLDDDVLVVRGSDYNGLAGMIEGDVFSFDDIKRIVDSDPSQLSMLEGLEVTNHAFTSTGIASDAGLSGEVKYKIFLPKGTQAIYAEPQSYFGNTISGEEIYEVGAAHKGVGSEAEVILQRGTKFRINKVTPRGGNDIEIELEVVEQPTFSTGKEQTI